MLYSFGGPGTGAVSPTLTERFTKSARKRFAGGSSLEEAKDDALFFGDSDAISKMALLVVRRESDNGDVVLNE